MGGKRFTPKVTHLEQWYDYVGLLYDSARIKRLEQQLALGPMAEVIPVGYKNGQVELVS